MRKPVLTMKIAIVDPSRTVRRIVGETVRRWGYSALLFGNGEEALNELASNDDIGVLITSAELPGCSGLDLCHSARTLAANRPLYIVLMSSFDEREKLVAALENGADDFNSKPPYPEELKARLRAADRILSMQASLARQATTDFLTGALNRRGFFEHATKIWRDVAAAKRMAALTVDLDHFKTVNDRHGHDAGDKVLVAVAREALDAGLQPVGRLGGEEFASLVDTQLEDAFEAAEHFRQAVAGIGVQT